MLRGGGEVSYNIYNIRSTFYGVLKDPLKGVFGCLLGLLLVSTISRN